MLELPECLTLARQLDEALRGKTISRAARGNSPHRFTFFTPPVEEIERRLPGRRVRGARAEGKSIFVDLDDGSVLLLRELDARIHWSPPAGAAIPAAASAAAAVAPQTKPPPKKYQFLLEFARGGQLTVTVSLWGLISLEESAAHGEEGVNPLGEEFTLERFRALLADYEKPQATIKAFLINRPRIRGFGNAYMQEMLFRAGILPTRRVAEIGAAESRRLHQAIRGVLEEAVRLGGSEDECDIYGRPGGYRKNLGARVRECRVCGTPIEKKAFLGGATYYCPRCQR